MNSIELIVQNLSDEEKDLHRDIIKECIERELNLIDGKKQLEGKLEKLDEIAEVLVNNIQKLEDIFAMLKNVSEPENTKLSEDILGIIPDDKFFNA